MRKAGQSVVGKTLIAFFFGLLIISFAIWGIGDIFRTRPPSTVAKIGDTEITVNALRTAYNDQLQRLSRQFRTVVSPQQARALGLDRQVLNNLVDEAVMRQAARRLGLSVSDQLVARSIVENPAFHGANGQFDRSLFEQGLRNANLSEAGFVQEQRSAMVRDQLAEAIAGGLTVPAPAREAMHRYATERRAASYFVLTSAMAGDIPAPTQEQLQTFYNDHQSAFQAPEYRAMTVMTLDASSIAKPDAVPEAEARQRYEKEQAKFGSPERRTVQQITFASKEEAQAAFDRIKQGTSFDTIAQEHKLSPQDLTIGTFAKNQMLDPAVADTAFSLQEGVVSNPIDSRFGPVLVRVTKIEPESVKPFEEVAGEVRQEIANERAQAQIDDIHDAIEDQRASARPLADIAKERGLTLLQIPAVDRQGLDKLGKPVDLPDREAVLKAAFASDIGVDNEPLRTQTGYVWYDVTGIDPTREKPLDEVRDQAVAMWREDEIAQRLAAKARDLTARIEKGEAVEAIAQEAGAPLKTATDLTRGAAKDDLSADAVNRIFAVPVGKAGNAETGTDTRAVFKVTTATVPPLDPAAPEAKRIDEQLRNGMSGDLISQYLAKIRQDLGVTIDERAVRQAMGDDL